MPENVTTTPDKLELEILRACGLAFPREHDAQAKAVTDALRLALNQALLVDEYLSSADPEQATLRSRWAAFDGSGCQEDGPACHAFLGEQCGSHDCGRFSQQDVLSPQRRKELNTRWWLANELRKLAGPGTYTSPLQRILMAVSLQVLGESNEQLRRLQSDNVLDAVFPLRLLAHEGSELGQRCIEWVGKIRSPESKLEKRDLLLELAPLLREVAVELGYPQQASADDESLSEAESFPEELDLLPLEEADADEEEFSGPEWLDPSPPSQPEVDLSPQTECLRPKFKPSTELVLKELRSSHPGKPSRAGTLARKLHFAANTVTKAVGELRRAGYKIETVRGEGYLFHGAP